MANFWSKIPLWLQGQAAHQTSTLFEWSVAAFAAGIGLYFAAPFEPSLAVLTLCGGVIGVIRAVLPAKNAALRYGLFLGFCLVLGAGRSAWHSQTLQTPSMPSYERSYRVTGWVSAVEKSGPRTRWRIQIASIEGLSPEETPVSIRTSSAGKGVKAGDTVRIKSVLSRPSGPAVPGGYDSGRRAFFLGIGGTGYAISKAEKLEDLVLPWPEEIRRKIVRMRYGLADRVLSAAPETTAGLQVGLLTGIRTYIPEDQTDSLRVAGLAHILAISGLHMGLLSGGVYFLATLGLAAIAPLARRMDVRKPAALIGAAAATGYLILSGASVATQRAFIMAMIVFLAVILDRRAFSMRSVALAAVITLLWHPEALTGAGFQMSFAAVAALVAVYRAWDAQREYVPRGPIGKAGQSLRSLTITSFVAGTATTGIAMLHFNRIATYGLAGNLLAMPIFTFWVMPAAMAVFPALLIGQEALPLAVMGKGLEAMLVMSGWVAGWPGSLGYVAAAPAAVIAVYGFAFAALCLGPRAMRALGLVLMPLCIAVWMMTPKADLRVSDSGVVAFWAESEAKTLYVSNKRSDKYGRGQFVRRAGQGEVTFETYQRGGPAQCDALACRVRLKGYDIIITSYPSEVMEECQQADLVILTSRAAGPISRRHCGAKLIDTRELGISGSQDIYLRPDQIKIKTSKPPSRKARPWG